MARLVDVNWRPSRSKLRRFGFLAGAVFGLAAWCAHRHLWVFSNATGAAASGLSVGFTGVAAFSIFASLFVPAANRPLYIGLTALTLPVGIVMSYLLLGLLFFAIIWPIRVVLWIAGIDPMNRRWRRDAPSYWVDSDASRPASSYFRQY